MQVYSGNFLLSITTLPAPPRVQLHQSSKSKQEEGVRLASRTHWSSLGKMDFLQALLSTFGKLKPVWRMYTFHKEKHCLSHETLPSQTRAFDDSGNKHFNPPNRDKSQGIYLFRFLGFFWLDLKHSTGTSLSMPEVNPISLGRDIPTKGSPEGFSVGLPNRKGHGRTDKASFSLILCLGRAANKATSNLHTTPRMISDSQGGPTGLRIKGGRESLPL